MDDATRTAKVQGVTAQATARFRWVTAKAIALYYYNVDADVWAEEFQTKLIDLGINSTRWLGPYPAEQMEKYARGFQAHFGELNFRHQQAQIEVVIDRYGEEASREWSLCFSFVRD